MSTNASASIETRPSKSVFSVKLGTTSLFLSFPRMYDCFSLMLYKTGVAIEIDNVDNDDDISKPRWYLPLLIVQLRGKTRVCHDARAATDGVCLNDLLVGGPNLMNSLMDILMRFRQWKIASMCDIKAFFHQVRVHPDDADLFRFLWFKDQSLCLAIIYLFLSHVYGSLFSSCDRA